jgi:hypothetical protein
MCIGGAPDLASAGFKVSGNLTYIDLPDEGGCFSLDAL